VQEFHDTLSALHRRLVDGDRAAFDLLTEKLLPLLTRRLTRRFRKLGPEVGDAVEDALLDYGSQPWRFDPSRASLATFLYRIAWRNAADRCRSDVRRLQREANWARARTDYIDAPRISEDLHALAKQLRVPASEIAVFRLWVIGERQTAPLAAALGLSELPAGEQRREVKRFHDRMRRRGERLVLRRSSPQKQIRQLRSHLGR
jgi:RNA polymerase sigma-70 factor (ECF subfamily)